MHPYIGAVFEFFLLRISDVLMAAIGLSRRATATTEPYEKNCAADELVMLLLMEQFRIFMPLY